MGDTRPWYKTDVGYFDNPKVADFMEDEPRVPILHLRAIAYCRQHLTDGVFPVRRVARLAYATYCGSECESLCDVCRATQNGLFDRACDGTYSVHDYAEHQQTAEQAGKRKAAGQKAAAARWGAGEGASSDAKGNANRIAKSNTEKRREEKKDVSTDRADVASLCNHLADRIETNGSKRPAITNAWLDAARRLIDLDKRPTDEAHQLIDWCQDSDFWKPNVMSMTKFRERYDTLRLQAKKNQPAPVNKQMPEGW